MAEITVVVPVWDTAQSQSRFTANCAKYLADNTVGDVKAIFVDNGSPNKDGVAVVEELAARGDGKVGLIKNDTNRGYGGGANQGLYQGYQEGSKFFIVCNNDIQFFSVYWYDHLIKPIREVRDRLVGVRLIPDNMWVYLNGQHHPYLEGFMLAFDRWFLDKVGYFDEIFSPAWVEDVDLSWRASRHGYHLHPVPETPIFHVYGQTGYDGRLNFMQICELNVVRFADKIAQGNDGWIGPPRFRSNG